MSRKPRTAQAPVPSQMHGFKTSAYWHIADALPRLRRLSDAAVRGVRHIMMGWHFINDDKTIRAYTDPLGHTMPHAGVTVRPGQTLQVCGLIARGSVANHPTFARGLFASPMPADALFHSPGMVVCRVRLAGQMIRGEHYAQAEQRTCLWMADATQAVWEWACWCGAQAIQQARQAGFAIEDCAEQAVKTRWKWLHGQATEVDVRYWMGRNRQAERFHSGKDSRGKPSDRAKSDPRIIHVYSLCTSLCAGYIYHKCGIAARTPGWYDTPSGVIENRRLEALLLALAPAELAHGAAG